MIINEAEFVRILNEIKANPDKQEELLKDFKLFHAFYKEDDGIPPRFGDNFRLEGPKWDKVTGLDFERIGRILVCHLSIEHYINNLIELSSPKEFNWEKTRMNFTQKINLIQGLKIFSQNEFIKGIRILNDIRNKLSHDLLGTIDENKLTELKSILLDIVCMDKSEEKIFEIKNHFELFGPHAVIERFTSITCAMIAGYCSSLVNQNNDGEEYYNALRSI
jgi:hypothetical protein